MRAIGWRSLAWASLLALRAAVITSRAASSVSVRPSASGGSGHGARWIEPACHQLHVSSVQNGSSGANRRWKIDRLVRSVARADAWPAAPRSP